MTKKEQLQIKLWNKEMSNSRKGADFCFKSLQEISERNNLPVYCSAVENMKQILLSSNTSENDKSVAVSMYSDYQFYNGVYDCVLNFVENVEMK